jgi:hypothetical protein
LGVGDVGDEVRRARAQRRETDARVAGHSAVHVGHERRALFVTRRDERDCGVPKREQKILDFLAGDAEHALDALGFEAVDEPVGC